MADLTPSNLPPLRTDAGRYRELEVLERLRDYMPAGFEVFHGVELHSVHDDRDSYGEIDLIVLAPDGCLLLLEIKAGPVLLRDGEIFKIYADGISDVARQGKYQRSAILHRLREAKLETPLLCCLVLPDYDLGDSQVVSIPRERIIDAPRYPEMVSTVCSWLGAVHSQVDRPALRRLLLNQFRAVPAVDVLRDQLQGTVRRLADGLATWVPRIGSPSGAFRIQATAGSGKTQLALQLLENTAAAGKHASYVCYNRSLADHVRHIATARVEVLNYHELCVDHYRRTNGEPVFNAEGFQAVTQAYLDASSNFAPSLDLLIIDEAQDFDADWVASLCSRLKPGGQLYVLEDRDQRLYQQREFEIGDAVTIDCRDNFRSPRMICDLINALALVSPPVRSMNPYKGHVPGIQTYSSDEQLVDATIAAVQNLLGRGFSLQDIVVVSGRGREKSVMTRKTTLGPYSIRHFTGEYDSNGEPCWSSGNLLVESVYRYKGQSVPAVVITEFDFAELDDTARRKLFVALTRAQMAAELVLSVTAERCLVAELS
ncbi:ATP-binding domain-containing protein [Undibacterium sp. WLHG33]|uniref:ATP-binding domain-containing protein n=1 Tax=Undibacterium sp. WLHG33 TaxID=3412482 RepID=UPI003C2D6578